MSRRTTLRLAAGAFLCAAAGIAAAQTQNTTYLYEYDANGNRTKITDPLTHVTVNQYDALNRLTRVTDPKLGLTQYGYDPLDHLIQITDPRNLVTQYVINGLGDQLAIQSPDTGNTGNLFDAAGNLKIKTDAKGQPTTYQYDVLNRVTLITYADGNTIAYQYDQGPNAIGRLTQITDATGTTLYGYDQHGRVTSDTRTIGGQARTTSYRYDPAGRLFGLTYPTGRSIDYIRDPLGRISQINTTKDGVTQPIVTQVNYQPFGPAQMLTFGNGQHYLRTYDLDGRTNGYTLNNQMQAITYDAASRIIAIADQGNPANTTNYGYDELDRLINLQNPAANLVYGYDAVGNRTSLYNGPANSNYSYSSSSNQLAQITGSQAAAIVTDPNGSITAKGANQFTYDARGRMVSATTTSGVVQYQINGLGQRVQKITPNDATVFHYDLAGKLIAETNTSTAGSTTVDYVYLNDMPVAVFK